MNLNLKDPWAVVKAILEVICVYDWRLQELSSGSFNFGIMMRSAD
jgi:hypothetical protein